MIPYIISKVEIRNDANTLPNLIVDLSFSNRPFSEPPFSNFLE